MARITASGLTDARARMSDRAKRVSNLMRPMKLIGQDLVKETNNALRNPKSPKGEQWPDIKDSTKLGRSSVRKRANARSKSGSLSRGALKFRAGLLASSKPLVDTGRLRNSVHFQPSRRSVRFSMVGYTGPHITGSAKSNLPKRNPTAFELAGGRWRLIPRLRTKYARWIVDHVEGRR